MDRCLTIQRHTQLGSLQAAQWFNPLYTNHRAMNELSFHSFLFFSKTPTGTVLVMHWTNPNWTEACVVIALHGKAEQTCE